MYKRFFGLNRNPFELSPDPSFMCPLGKSEETLASIYHAILRRKGFVVLTGEVGTGKTLTVRYLCKLWRDRQIPFANIIAPRLSVTEFLGFVTFDLGIKIAEPSKGNLLRALYEFLLAQFAKGLTTVLVVDEAHQLRPSVLEEIRLLTNFETGDEKLLQILLVGQPELDKKLDSFELRQLKQRIAIRCQLEPLCEDETRRYIERRLSLAGASARASTMFPADTVHAIYRYSSGIPRLVNSICEQALIAAYARQIIVVPVEVIDELARYFRLHPVPDIRQTEHFVSRFEDNANAAVDPVWSTPIAVNAPAQEHLDAKVFPGPSELTPSVLPEEPAVSLLNELLEQKPIQQSTSNEVLSEIFDETCASPKMPEKPQEASLASEDLSKVPNPTLGPLTVERKLDVNHDKSSPKAPAPPKFGTAAQRQHAPQSWTRRNLAGASVVFLLVLSGGGIFFVHSGALENAAPAPPPETTDSPYSAPETAQPSPAPDPDPAGTGNESDSGAAKANAFKDQWQSVQIAPTAEGGELQEARLLSSVPVVYPAVARQTHTQGDVIIEAFLDPSGIVTHMRVVSGPTVLRQSALDSLRRWRYEPSTLNGQPVAVKMLVTIHFRE
jgi:general secretion pathway protein A